MRLERLEAPTGNLNQHKGQVLSFRTRGTTQDFMAHKTVPASSNPLHSTMAPDQMSLGALPWHDPSRTLTTTSAQSVPGHISHSDMYHPVQTRTGYPTNLPAPGGLLPLSLHAASNVGNQFEPPTSPMGLFHVGPFGTANGVPGHIHGPQFVANPNRTVVPSHGRHSVPVGLQHAEQPQQKKPHRAQNACEGCRGHKAKCDENRPCKRCVKTGLTCVYTEPSPSRLEPGNQQIVNHIDLTAKLIIAAIQDGPGLPPIYRSMTKDQLDKRPVSRSDNPRHRAGVHYLLNCPAITGMLHDGKWTAEYTRHELKRQHLEPEACWDSRADRAYPMIQNNLVRPMTPTSWESFQTELQSVGFTKTNISLEPPDLSSTYTDMENTHIGGLSQDGTSLALEPRTVNRLLLVYLKTLHDMHPFLNKKELSDMCSRVCDFANGRQELLAYEHAARDSDATLPLRPLKRTKTKTSSTPTQESPNVLRHGLGTPQRSELGKVFGQTLECHEDTALVLLVLALGKICEVTVAFPGSSAPEDMAPYLAQRNKKNLSNSFNSDLVSPAASFGQYSHSDSTFTQRNMDVVPGLAYYSKAVQILGSRATSSSLHMLQASLLASLYMGQLARPNDAYVWLWTASRILHSMADELSVSADGTDENRDQKRLTFWSCFQFEGDFLAEFEVKATGVTELGDSDEKFQEFIPMPQNNAEGNQSEELMICYYFQVFLRKLLNNVQQCLYPVDDDDNIKTILSRTAHAAEGLEEWRRKLPNSLAWVDDEYSEVEGKIHIARLRAKYYYAKCLIHRRAVEYALAHTNRDDYGDAGMFIKDESLSDSEGSSPRSMNVLRNIDTHVAARLLRACQTFYQAAKRSTTIFDSIIQQRRLIVPNIYGTAQSQFGNCLVLAAIARSPLSDLFEDAPRTAKRLIRRTITFLTKLAPLSTTFRTNIEILRSLDEYFSPRDTKNSFGH